MSESDESQKISVKKSVKMAGTKFFDQTRVLDDDEDKQQEEVRNKWQELESKRERKPIANRSDLIDKNTRSMGRNVMQMVEMLRDMPNSMNPLAEFVGRRPGLLDNSTYLHLSAMRDGMNLCEMILSYLSNSFKIAIRHKYKAGNAGDLWRCVVSYLFPIGDDPEEKKAFERALTDMNIQEVGRTIKGLTFEMYLDWLEDLQYVVNCIPGYTVTDAELWDMAIRGIKGTSLDELVNHLFHVKQAMSKGDSFNVFKERAIEWCRNTHLQNTTPADGNAQLHMAAVKKETQGTCWNWLKSG